MLSDVTTPHDLDDRLRAELAALGAPEQRRDLGERLPDGGPLTGAQALALFDAQLTSRLLDLAGQWLHGFGEGYHTIESAGHEGNAAVAAALRPTDPALLHHRSGAFYCLRAAQAAGAFPTAPPPPVPPTPAPEAAPDAAVDASPDAGPGTVVDGSPSAAPPAAAGSPGSAVDGSPGTAADGSPGTAARAEVHGSSGAVPGTSSGVSPDEPAASSAQRATPASSAVAPAPSAVIPDPAAAPALPDAAHESHDLPAQRGTGQDPHINPTSQEQRSTLREPERSWSESAPMGAVSYQDLERPGREATLAGRAHRAARAVGRTRRRVRRAAFPWEPGSWWTRTVARLSAYPICRSLRPTTRSRRRRATCCAALSRPPRNRPPEAGRSSSAAPTSRSCRPPRAPARTCPARSAWGWRWSGCAGAPGPRTVSRRRRPGPPTPWWSAPSATPRSTTPRSPPRSTPPAGTTTPACVSRCCSCARTAVAPPTGGWRRRCGPGPASATSRPTARTWPRATGWRRRRRPGCAGTAGPPCCTWARSG